MKEVVSEEGIKLVKRKENIGKKAVVNPKPVEEHDNNELATSNNTVNTAPEMSSLHTETPLTAQSSPKSSLYWSWWMTMFQFNHYVHVHLSVELNPVKLL